MPKDKFVVCTAPDGYMIVAPDGTESEVAEYGDPCFVLYGGYLYAAILPEQETVHQEVDANVFLVTPQPTEVEDQDEPLDETEEDDVIEESFVQGETPKDEEGEEDEEDEEGEEGEEEEEEPGK